MVEIDDGPNDVRPLRFRVVPNEEGMMLANLLARRIPGISLTRAQTMIQAGGVYLGHVRIRIPTVRVAAGERITAYPIAADVTPLPREALTFVHRDSDFVVLDKPAGVPVTSTKQHSRGSLAEALIRHLSDEGVDRPYVGVVHRLDQTASGLVLFTIRSVANRSLQREFEEHRIVRKYRAILLGSVDENMRCEAPLLEPVRGMVRVGQAGDSQARAARTNFRRLALVASGEESLVEVELETGRTHQIRVHAQALGHPIKGDRRYGNADAGSEPRMYLHAASLQFTHPRTGVAVEVRGELPAWAITPP